MGRKSITKQIKRSIEKILAISFVVVYVAGNSHLEWISSITHDHPKTFSPIAKEQDACYRTIHGDFEHGCHHDAHWVPSDDCKQGDVAFHGDQFFVPTDEFLQDHVTPEKFALLSQDLHNFCAVISSSRAPPFSVNTQI